MCKDMGAEDFPDFSAVYVHTKDDCVCIQDGVFMSPFPLLLRLSFPVPLAGMIQRHCRSADECEGDKQRGRGHLSV